MQNNKNRLIFTLLTKKKNINQKTFNCLRCTAFNYVDYKKQE